MAKIVTSKTYIVQNKNQFFLFKCVFYKIYSNVMKLILNKSFRVHCDLYVLFNFVLTDVFFFLQF